MDEGLYNAPDAATVTVGSDERFVNDAHHHHFRTVGDVRRWMARRGRSGWHGALAMLRCEIEQHDAALAVGVEPDQMRFRLTWRRGKPAGKFTRRRYGVRPELGIRQTGPKLAIASIYAAPTHPTEFDLQRLRDFGYRDVEHVNERIEVWNAEGRVPTLPLRRS